MKEAGVTIINADYNIIIERTATDEEITQVINYINKFFNTQENSVIQLENCRKLSNYLTKHKITIGDLEAEELLDKSQILNNTLNKLHDARLLPKAYGFIKLLNLLEIYSQKNKINLDTDFDVEFYGKDSEKDLDLFKLYLNEISQYKILSREEELELGKRAKNGDIEAKNKLVEHNLRLVIPIAKRYVSPELSIQELVLSGNEGLMTAARKFDPEYGYKFSTYATWWIRQALQKGVMECGRTIRIPAHIYEYTLKFKREMAIYYTEKGCYPSNEYLSEKFGIPEEKVLDIRQCMEPIVSLSTPVGGEDKDSTLGDFLEDENNPFDESIDALDANQLADELINSSKLSDKEREVLKLRFGFYGDTKTLEEIGRHYNLSRERIRQIERLALKKLLKVYSSKRFRNLSRRLSR